MPLGRNAGCRYPIDAHAPCEAHSRKFDNATAKFGLIIRESGHDTGNLRPPLNFGQDA